MDSNRILVRYVYVVTRLELMVKLNLTKITILTMMMRRLPEDKKGRRLAGMGGMIIVTFYEKDEISLATMHPNMPVHTALAGRGRSLRARGC